MKAVILAGGEGTRLRPLTLTTPKPVVPVVDRPFLRHQLDLLAGAGVREVVFSVAYRPERVEAVFGDGSAFGLRIRYAVEDTPLGTGGAVRNALPLLDERTIVLNGDVLTDVDLGEVVARHEAEGAAATILLTPVPNPAAYGLVETDPEGRVLRFLEKPRPEQITTNTINAGRLRARDARARPDARGRQLLDRARLLPRPARPGRPGPRARPPRVLDRHRHAGEVPPGPPRHPEPPLPRPPGRGAPRRRASCTRPPACRKRRSSTGTSTSGPGCEVEAGARLGPDAVLVADVRVRAGAYLRDSVLWRGVEAGPDCEVQGSLVGPGVRLGRSSVLRNAVLGEGSVVSDYSRTL